MDMNGFLLRRYFHVYHQVLTNDMKTLVVLTSIILLFSLSCKEEEKKGTCTACCDTSGGKICKGNFTDKMCADYNENLIDGHDWIFAEGSIECLPSFPN